MTRGFWGIGIFHPKTDVNIGTLLRTAFVYGAQYVFTVGKRYHKQASDTTNTMNHVPLFEYKTIKECVDHLPRETMLVGVELSEEARDLRPFCHPERAAYLLGAEDHGIPPRVLERCHAVVQIPGGEKCLNVSVAGSLVIYDRWSKRNPFEGEVSNGH